MRLAGRKVGQIVFDGAGSYGMLQASLEAIDDEEFTDRRLAHIGYREFKGHLAGHSGLFRSGDLHLQGRGLAGRELLGEGRARGQARETSKGQAEYDRQSGEQAGGKYPPRTMRMSFHRQRAPRRM